MGQALWEVQYCKALTHGQLRPDPKHSEERDSAFRDSSTCSNRLVLAAKTSLVVEEVQGIALLFCKKLT